METRHHQRRTLLAPIMVMCLLGSWLVASTAAADHLSKVAWEGHGDEHIEGCTTGYHWILAPGGGITSTPLFYSDLDGGEEMFRMSANTGENAAWHYNSGLVDLDEGVTPYVKFEGTPHPQIKLIISHCLDDEDGPIDPRSTLDVNKDAETSYKRTHKWDIDKWIDTDEGHTVDEGTPKIWLYTDGRGEETATWTVDVTYEGFRDNRIKVSGEIFISNAGPFAAANINSVTDVISQPIADDTDADVDCGLDEEEWPYRLEVGEELVCSYWAKLDAVEDGLNTATVEATFLYSELDPADFNQDGPFVDEDVTETGTADVEFGDPDKEKYATVDVKDISDLFGEVDLGSVTAPDGDTFTYDKDFAYEDYGDANCGGHRYDNTAEIVQTGQTADATLKVNVQCLLWESAWAKGTGDGPGPVTPHAFCDNGFANWGWSNEIGQPYSGIWPLYAGAGQCDVAKGELVGHFRVDYNGGFDYEFVPLDDSIEFEGAAVYAGNAMFPTLRNGRATVAPGQYAIQDPLSGNIYVIAHVNAGVPDPDFGP